MMATRESIGFIGLGVMGAPMAGHLLDAGYTVTTTTHRRPVARELSTKGIVEVASAAEVAAASDVVITMVPDTPDVEAVLFGANGVAEGLKASSLVVDMSSISPSATVTFAERIRAAGGRYLDAPVSGGEVGAQAASLTIMVGGQIADFERARPIFEVVGSRATLIGDVGAGQVCKVANQIVVAGTIQAVAEGLLFAAAHAVDAATVREALMGGLASSRILEVHGERMIARTFDPGFRITLHAKDLALALSGARDVGAVLPLTALTAQLLASNIANAGGDEDHSALVRAIERLSDTTISAP
jgi:2-hydroxy-3-oxopropionate reductase